MGSTARDGNWREGASVLECASPLALWLLILALAVLFAATGPVQAQPRAYIGFVYPAGGQQGTMVPVKVGGQNLDGTTEVLVTGTGVTGRVVECFGRLNNQQITLLSEQLKELKAAKPGAGATMMSSEPPMMSADAAMMSSGGLLIL